ncbi:RicAFT regulatory complex protein RicA family protein [Mechercharimyces sp. CAU 1602]|uniref:RicAFT regulatory complex protein RicA family protein n=1 Tax=Mechercharimyces sp. CAU 1602 TaxID=2973933 RepID=UPI002163C83B|nr:YlbF family regulator [Mechercharimyces sp. CAU 1602]MCS1351213.1 YlbF family regulator [Mechercharimyces sp. CAU 1602]
MAKMRQDVLSLARHFGEELTQVDEVASFRSAEAQIDRSERVQQLIEMIKKKQKELVHAKHYQKEAHIGQVEVELDELNQQLDTLPIVREYQQSQMMVNDLLQMIQQTLAVAVTDQIEVETGNVAPSGCGNGGPCACS